MTIEVKTKKWGNSIGIVIPKETVETLDLGTDEAVIIEIEKKDNVLKELFGSLKFDKPTNKIIKDLRKELEGKWLN